MNCPKCNKPNREKAVFCKWCGTNVVTKATEPLRVGGDGNRQEPVAGFGKYL